MKTRVSPGNHVLDEGADPPTGRDNFRGLSGPFKNIGNLGCSCRFSVAAAFAAKGIIQSPINVMQQKGSFSMPDKRKYKSGKFWARAMRPIGWEGVMGVHSASQSLVDY